MTQMKLIHRVAIHLYKGEKHYTTTVTNVKGRGGRDGSTDGVLPQTFDSNDQTDDDNDDGDE